MNTNAIWIERFATDPLKQLIIHHYTALIDVCLHPKPNQSLSESHAHHVHRTYCIHIAHGMEYGLYVHMVPWSIYALLRRDEMSGEKKETYRRRGPGGIKS